MTLILIAVTAHVWLARSPATLNTTDDHAVIQDRAALPERGADGPAPSAELVDDTRAAVNVSTKLVPVSTTGVVAVAPATGTLRAGREPQPTGTSGIAAAPATASAPAREMPDDTVTSEHARNTENSESSAAPPVIVAPLSAAPRRPLTGIVPSIAPVATKASASPRAIHAEPIVEPDQKALVLRVLNQYAAAFGRLDVDATKAVYPTVNYSALRRAFNQLETQRVTFDVCRVSIDGREANARCQGEAAYRPRVGPRSLQRASREWTFNLSKADEVWQIVKATVR